MILLKSNLLLTKKKFLPKNYGHYYYDATYKFNSDIEFINKQEYKAKKYSYNMLVSFEKLKLAIKNRN